jgi:hypothetical protein
MNGALTQIHRELEEAGAVSGAARLKMLTKVTLPLLLPRFLMGCIWVAAHAFRSTQHSTDAEHEGYSYDQRFSLSALGYGREFFGSRSLKDVTRRLHNDPDVHVTPLGPARFQQLVRDAT